MSRYTHILASQVLPGDVVIVSGHPETVSLTVEYGDTVLIYLAGDDGCPITLRGTWPLAYTHLAPRPASPSALDLSDRQRVRFEAAVLGLDAHPAPCRVPASPNCTC